MKNADFVHLHCHSSFSLLDGLSSPETLAKRASELGFKYLALTDHASVSGCIKFQKACEKNNISPIFGIEFYIVPDITIKDKGEKRGHIVALCKNETGWININKMLTIANLHGFYKRPRIDYRTFLEYSDGLVFSTACVSSFLNQRGGLDFFDKLVFKHSEDVYLECMGFSTSEQKNMNETCLRLKNKYSECKLVATNDIHFCNKDDALTHEILLLIQQQKTFNSKDKWTFDRAYDVYMKSADEMISSFIKQDQLDRKEYLSAIKNTIEVAEKCSGFRIENKEISLPRVKGIDKKNENEYLKGLCIQGMVKKELNNNKIYLERMEYELGVIFSKQLTPYFLLVWDLVNWCNNNHILVGPGRGSVGGSLVAYLLGITNVDPIKYNLPFSRFINEERIDYPDVDLDFEDSKRNQVFTYLQNTYGENNVAGISTFLVLKSRSAIRDVCRVYDIPLKEADELAKSIPFNSNIKDELEKGNETISKFKKKYPETIEQIFKIEGTIRGVSRHAAGVIVSNEDLTIGNRCNLENRDGNICINWEKEDAEKQGLMKLDVLGLSTLSVLSYTKELIGKNHKKNIVFEDIDLEDKDVIKMLSDGYTTGIFQAGTVPMTLLIKEMGLETFDHLTDAVALVRPGAKDAGATDNYIKRKHGESWKRKHPIYEEVTSKTYGVIVTQEQIMNIIHKVAGLSYAISDKIRKIIGKKRDASEFQQFKDMFINGCKKQETLSEEESNEFWNGLQHAAHYLFNQCLSGKETIYGRYSIKKQRLLSIEELYLTMNSSDFARMNDTKDLRGKLKRNGYGLAVSMFDDNRLRENKIINIKYSGMMNIFLVTTESGKNIKCTMNHSFPTPFGSKKLEELKINDLLFVRDEYEICKNTYNLYEEGKAPSNTPEPGEKGFQEIPNGRSVVLDRIRDERHKNKTNCEECGYKYDGIKRFELHHKDFDRFNNKEENLQFICVSCHKKLHYNNGRIKRYEKGVPVKTEKIISIDFLEFGPVYDVEMDAPNHNFLVGSGIVTSNSHSTAYAMIGMWTAWLKYYYPAEFIAASLTYGGDDHKQDLIKEAKRLGLKVLPPKIGISDSLQWKTDGRNLYCPIVEIKGIGEKTLEKLSEKSTGFFKIDNGLLKGKARKIFEEIDAFNPDSPLPFSACSYFDIDICEDYSNKYPKLKELYGNRFFDYKIEDLLIGNVNGFHLVEELKEKPDLKSVVSCTKCDLHKECDHKILPSFGKYDIMVLGEAGYNDEHKEKKPFVGRAGKILWKELKRYDLDRDLFYVFNSVFCAPLKSKNPKQQHIDICKEFVLNQIEIVKPKIILCLGNWSRYCLTGELYGIIKANATMKWSEDLGCYLVFCMHPSSTFRSAENMVLFSKGIEFFSQKLYDLGGI